VQARSQFLFAVSCLLTVTAVAHAQAPKDVECKKTETQSECHDRLKCKADEELEDCQKRLLKCKAGESVQACEQRVAGQTPSGTNGTTHPSDANGDRGASDQNRDNDSRPSDTNDRDRDDGGDRGRDRGERDDGGGSRHYRRRRDSGRGGFEANKTFGLGLELGNPTGLNGKVFVSPRSAIDFGVGYILDDYYFGEGLHVYADYLWHPVSLATTQSFELPFYVGGGLRYWNFTYCYMGVCNYGGDAIGIRIPLGLAIDFNNVPLDIFVQLVPVLDFVGGQYFNQYGDRAHFAVDGSVGIRYWFK